MSTTTLKKSTPERNTGADCPVCQSYRYSIDDFCCNCGKRLKDTRVLVNRYAPSWHDLICKSGHGRTKENAPDWNAGVDCAFCQNYRDIGENFCGICGKKLTEPTVPMGYDFGPSFGHNFGITIHHHSPNGHVLEDGRLKYACEGTMVDVRSIAEYIERPKQIDFETRLAKRREKAGIECEWHV